MRNKEQPEDCVCQDEEKHRWFQVLELADFPHAKFGISRPTLSSTREVRWSTTKYSPRTTEANSFKRRHAVFGSPTAAIQSALPTEHLLEHLHGVEIRALGFRVLSARVEKRGEGAEASIEPPITSLELFRVSDGGTQILLN